LFLVGGAFAAASLLSAQESDLEMVRQRMGDAFDVKIEHEEKVEPGTDDKPPLKRESWAFRAGVVRPMVRYSRYLNGPPDFAGNYPSLANSDMGLGFDGGAWGNWYRGNALRVLVNGQDLFAAQPAAEVEWQEGDNGRLRLIWELEEGRSLTLNLIVPEDGHAIYAHLEIANPARVDSLQVQLMAYPGGYGPAYQLPSHRWVSTARQEAEVPKDYADKEFPKVSFTAGDAWILYADKLVDDGSLGLLVRPEEGPSGEIRLSSYGVQTLLNYPPETRHIHLGFYAYNVVNAAARRLFVDSVNAELEALRRHSSWQKQPG
jgi:hypothetical protein